MHHLLASFYAPQPEVLGKRFWNHSGVLAAQCLRAAVKDGAELLNLLNDDGMKWATAFTQYLKKVEGIDVDVSYAFTWFANAIEHSNTYRRWQKEAAEKEALDYPPT